MDLGQRVNELESAQAIAVTHLLYRYLTHRLDERSFRNAFRADPSNRGNEQAYAIALDAIHEIEGKEHQKVRDLPGSILSGYIEQLAGASHNRQTDSVDPALRDEAERELQLFRSM